MKPASRMLTISAAVATMLALAACDPRQYQTVDQAVERGVATAKAAVSVDHVDRRLATQTKG